MTPGVRDEGTGEEEERGGAVREMETRGRKRERASAAASWSGPAHFRSRIPVRGMDGGKDREIGMREREREEENEGEKKVTERERGEGNR